MARAAKPPSLLLLPLLAFLAWLVTRWSRELDPLWGSPASNAAWGDGGTNDLKQSNSPLVDFVLERVDLNRNIVLIYASYSYKVPLMNWLAGIARLEHVRNVAVICLDAELAEYLSALQFPCLKLADMSAGGQRLDLNSVKQLWVLRSLHVLELLNQGINVVLSDSDALWLRDPFASGLFSPASGDLVAGRGRFPYDQAWGAAICMGVVYLRACPGVIAAATAALELTRKTNDDQVGYNRALATFPGGGPKAFGREISPVDNIPAKCILGSIGAEFSVRLVEHNIIPRECQRVSQAEWKTTVQVAHCHVADGVPAATNKNKGNQKSHSEVLFKYNLYFLRDFWESDLKEKITNGLTLWEALSVKMV